ncbi:MAG: DUF2066 domain-containing protein [Thiotrichaceae bacterium]|nr:DUF2066 domain-containing protein [Thiotrichaceae bacterium]
MKIKFLLVSLFLFIANPAWSLDLYQAQVVVADTDEEHRLPALKQVLQQILIKLTGIQNVDLKKENLDNVENWVRQFSYKSETGLVWLEATFNQKEVKALIEKLGLRVWQQPRPMILVWIAHKDEIINDAQQVDRMQVLKTKAKQYGVELIFPILDLYERRSFSLKQITAYRLEDIQQLAKRYMVDAVLVGNIELDVKNESLAVWQLFYNNTQINWKSNDKQLSNLLISAVEKTVDKVSPKSVQNINAKSNAEKSSAIKSEPKPAQAIVNTDLNLTITDVPNLSVYAKINRYLKALPEVKSIEMKNMSSNQLVFEITAKMTLEQFVQTLQAGKMIIIQSQTVNSITGKFEENL